MEKSVKNDNSGFFVIDIVNGLKCVDLAAKPVFMPNHTS
jgi:hypothetical protein